MKAYYERIECMAVWGKDGSINPIRFKFKGKVYGHIQIKYMNANKHAGNVMYEYTCIASCEGQEHPCELRYELSTCIWYLYKI